MRKGSQRPDYILLDDLLGEDDITEESTNKLLDTIKKSVMNLGGTNVKLPCVMTSTPLAPDDLTQRLKKDSNWSTITFPAITSFGDIDSRLWKDYWEIYEAESVEDRPHAESDDFYKNNQSELEAGFELYNPDCYTPGENISGVQALM